MSYFQKKTFREDERVSGLFQNTGQHKWSSWEPCKVVETILDGKFLILLIDMKYMNIISMFKRQSFVVIITFNLFESKANLTRVMTLILY